MDTKSILCRGLVGLFLVNVISRISLVIIIGNFHFTYMENRPGMYCFIVSIIFMLLRVIIIRER